MGNQKKLLGGLLVVLLIAVSFTAYYVVTHRLSLFKAPPHVHRPLTKRVKPPKLAATAYARHFPTSFQNQTDFVRQFFYLKTNTPQTWVTLPPEANDSVWESKEKTELARLTAGQAYDVMVLPVQMNVLVLDRTTRLLVAQIIADEIASSTTRKVMPVELAQRLLGEHSYRFSEQDVMALAKRYQVKRVISLFVNRDHAATPHYELGYYVKTAGRRDKSGYIFVPGITVTHPIEMMAWEKAGEIVKKIYPDSTPRPPTKYQTPPAMELGASLIQQVTASTDPYVQAVNLQLLGMLTSPKEFEERNRYMARSLMALRHVDPGTVNYHTLFARAMFYLYRRPLAMQWVEQEHTPQAVALLAMMNGNLPELKEDYAKITDPIFKLFTYIEINDLAYHYGKDGSDVNYPARNVAWANLIDYRRQDDDGWLAPATTRFMLSIGDLYPSFEKQFVNTLKEKSIVGAVQPYDTKSEFLFVDVYSKLIHDDRTQLSQNVYGDSATRYDVLRVFRSLGIANTLHRLDKSIHILALPEDAKRFSDAAEAYFSGNVAFLLRKIEIDDALLNTTEGVARTQYVKNITDTGFLIINIDAATDENTLSASYYLGKHTREYLGQFKYTKSAYNVFFNYQDIPSSYMWFDRDDDPAALQYTYSNFDVLKNAYDKYAKLSQHDKLSAAERRGLKVAAINHEKIYTVSELDKELSTRFDGSPEKVPYMASRAEKAGNIAAAEQILEKAVTDKSDNWKVYYQLSTLYLENSEYQQASDTFLKYPGFTHMQKGKEVATSNESYDAGSSLYWVGEYDKARTFYEISAKLDTGSGGSLNSKLRLSILDKKYLQAASIARYAATRYNNEFRYRDYLIFLNLFGYTDQALAGFKELAPRFDRAQVWSGLFVGQRIQGLSGEKVADWVGNYKATASEKVKRDANRYVVLQSIVDRNIDDKSLEKADAAIELDEKPIKKAKPVTPASDLYAYLTGTARKNDESAREMTPPPVAVTQQQVPIFIKKPLMPEDIVTVPNQAVLFLNAYQQLASRHYDKAFELFTTYTRFYRVENNNFPFGYLPVPYIAYAAIKTDNAAKIKQYLSEQPEFAANNKYFFNLTKSVLLAGDHDIEGSLHALDAAFSSKSEADLSAVYIWYELFHFCEWLGETTSDKRYIAKALDWAKKYEIIQPQFGYAYAFDAKYSTKTQDRIKAAAFAQYLDPKSRWLAAVPKKIKHQAKQWWKKNNPFVIPKMDRPSNKVRTSLRT